MAKMSHPLQPFRFGLLVETREATREGLIELARRAEDVGFSIVLGTDHFGRLAALPLLQAVAEATGLRIGTLVFNNDFRHPVVLAQELASIDVVTGGRLEIGLGAGWNRPEYEAAGMSFEAPGLRVDRLVATVRLLKQAFSEGRIERAADRAYPAINLADMPRSTQQPHPPLLVGGGGRRVLSFAAREADIVGLDPRALPEGGHDPADVTEAATERKLAWIREAAGERLAQLDINVIVFDVIADAGHRAGAQPDRAAGLTEEELRRSPHYLIGDAGAIADDLLARRARWGINYIAIRPWHLDAMAPVVERLAGS
jgi:probable F420-dependent oxidoreductase